MWRTLVAAVLAHCRLHVTAATPAPVALLQELCTAWSTFTTAVRALGVLFAACDPRSRAVQDALEREACAEELNADDDVRQPLYTQAVRAFCTTVLSGDTVHAVLAALDQQLATRCRLDLAQRAVQVLGAAGMQLGAVQSGLVDCAARRHQQRAAAVAEDLVAGLQPVPEYILAMQQQLAAERQSAASCALPLPVSEALADALQDAYIGQHLDLLVNGRQGGGVRGCAEALFREVLEGASAAYHQWLYRGGGGDDDSDDPALFTVGPAVQTLAAEVLRCPGGAQALAAAFARAVRAVVGVYSITAFIATACAVRVACRDACNSHPAVLQAASAALLVTGDAADRTATELSKYMDRYQRAKLGACARCAAAVLPYVSSKDVLFAHVAQCLGRRLLEQSPPSAAAVDAEVRLVARLKAAGGPAWTSPLEAMLADAAASLPPLAHGGQLLHVRLLKAAAWRCATLFVPQVQLLPAPLRVLERAYVTAFEASEPTKHLTWLHVYGVVTLNVQFAHATVRVQGTPLQAAVLLYLDEHGPTSVLALCTGLEASLRVVCPVVASLLGREVVTVQGAVPGQVAGADIVAVHWACACDQRLLLVLPRPKLPFLRRASSSAAHVERVQALQAAIMRVCKARGRIVHAALLEHLSQSSLHFAAEPGDVCRCVEALAQQGYIAIEPGGKEAAYAYIA